MMNPIAIMTSLNMQSMSLLLSGCPSHSSTRAGPRSPTTRSKTLHLGHAHFSTPSGPISSGFIHGYPFLRSNSWQRFNKGVVRAKKQSEESVVQSSERAKEAEEKPNVQEEEVEEEVELSWIQEKAEDLVEFTGAVTQVIPGPRVGHSSLPWILAVPLAYTGLSLVIAVVKTIRKLNSPKEKRRRLVNQNARLCKTLDDFLQSKRHELNHAALKQLMHKTGFDMEDILRKYIRYSLNEKPFNPDLVAGLIHLRKSSMLDDADVAEVLNEVSRRIVKEKGPVVMDTSGFTEKGIKRKAAVQALFSKLLYLSELDEFCSTTRGSLSIKEIFGVTDEDADALRIETLSEVSDVDSLENMVKLPSDSDSDSEEADTVNR